MSKRLRKLHFGRFHREERRLSSLSVPQMQRSRLWSYAIPARHLSLLEKHLSHPGSTTG